MHPPQPLFYTITPADERRLLAAARLLRQRRQAALKTKLRNAECRLGADEIAGSKLNPKP